PLNTPAHHPARHTQDTCYVRPSSGNGVSPAKPQLKTQPLGNSARLLLRTHTSSVQTLVMQTQQPPIRIIVPGRTYRRDNADATNNPTFQHIEGLSVEQDVR